MTVLRTEKAYTSLIAYNRLPLAKISQLTRCRQLNTTSLLVSQNLLLVRIAQRLEVCIKLFCYTLYLYKFRNQIQAVSKYPLLGSFYRLSLVQRFCFHPTLPRSIVVVF